MPGTNSTVACFQPVLRQIKPSRIDECRGGRHLRRHRPNTKRARRFRRQPVGVADAAAAAEEEAAAAAAEEAAACPAGLPSEFPGDFAEANGA